MDEQWLETWKLVDTSRITINRSHFLRDRYAAIEASKALENAAGNFYINDKPTGAVVGQQPFGGSRGSGTNDKAGSYMNLLRWVNARTIKVLGTTYRLSLSLPRLIEFLFIKRGAFGRLLIYTKSIY